MSAPTVPDGRWLWENEPCRAACPVHTDAGGYVSAIAEGRFEDAYQIARAHNPFPSICGRVCAAPCETSCRRGAIDAPVSIRALKRFVSERFGVESFGGAAEWHCAHGSVPPVGEHSVGIIGGGPGGLAAAHDLRVAGHQVTVYEAESRLGGMMVLGIPEYRLPRALIDRETDAIVSLGIEVRLNCQIGRDISFVELLDRHDALFVCVGAGRGRDLDIPGHDFDGVVRAVEFLLNVNRGFRVELGSRVVVVGGGNVAFDAARTALRAAARGEDPPDPAGFASEAVEHARRSITTTFDAARAAMRAGVREVTVIALESFEEMPATLEEIRQAEDEGIRIRYRRGPHALVSDGPIPDRVTGLETIEVRSVFDAAGRFAPVFLPGTEEVLAADTVILAVGQAPDVTFLPAELGFERTRSGGIAVDAAMRTSHPKVWAGRDATVGPRNLIDAIADGQRAATSIDAALAGRAGPSAHSVAVELRAKPLFRRLATDYDAVDRVAIPSVARDRRVGFAEVEIGYDEGHAMLEAMRCLRCFDNVMLRPELCILCGLCVDVCPYDCISIVRADTAGVGGSDQSALLLDEKLCIRCGLCVNRCPPSALVMVHAKEIAA